MDPVCHTLTGAALGEAGLKRRSGLGMATLIIGANLPDIDVIAIALDRNLELRRGWTHGVLALVVLPLLLTGLILAYDRWVRRRGGRVPGEPVVPRQVLLLATLAILTHPTLDFLNNYGMRWLMPFRDEWFYGDALFIIDPWVWLVLGVGVLLARRRARRGEVSAERPARGALAVTGVYALLMLSANPLGRWYVTQDLARAGVEPQRLMVSPVLGNSLRREVVYEAGAAYGFGRLYWLAGPRLVWSDRKLAQGPLQVVATAAEHDREARAFLHWARFPFAVLDTADGTALLRIGDARYTTDVRGGWATMTLPLEPRAYPGVARGSTTRRLPTDPALHAGEVAGPEASGPTP